MGGVERGRDRNIFPVANVDVKTDGNVGRGGGIRIPPALMQDVGVEIKIQQSNRLTEGEADCLLFILRVGVIVFVINVVSVAVKMAIGEAIGCQ